MLRLLSAALAASLAFAAFPASAQTGDGSLRGYVKDEQGGVLPGVTVTAKSPDLLAPVIAVSDTAGYYRLNNMPPGTFTVTAELSGFATTRREGIVMRAGLTFTVDIEMKVGTLSETVTVSGESPMIETSKPTSILNMDGELLRAAPVTARRLFSDVLDVAPGIGSRNVDDGVGRRAYTSTARISMRTRFCSRARRRRPTSMRPLTRWGWAATRFRTSRSSWVASMPPRRPAPASS
jgi:hypothetical protein